MSPRAACAGRQAGPGDGAADRCGSGNHIWAERYDRDLADIFAVQDEITRDIVTNIAPMLVADLRQLATRKPPEDMRAYDYYLESAALVEMASTAADLTAADELSDRAIAIDPTFARAYSTKAFSQTVAVMIFEFEDAAGKARPGAPARRAERRPQPDGQHL